MSNIPEDIMQTARSEADTVSFGGYSQNTLTIARVLLAERQRCADLADKEADGYKENGFPQAALGCITTRKAILSQ